ncbi:MAG: transglutaminase-like domain-containing protein [Chloroflexota bacterium]|nr:transglutaminase-like domain-containing protein [Chloroflexota bacterium]
MQIAQTVREVVEQIVAGAESELEIAIMLHDYVRDNVKFGFNKYFDAAPPDYTLAYGYGHCNPKSLLMVSLFRTADLESYQHFVVIPKDILKDAIPASRYWMIPAELSHSYVEIKVEGVWCSIDSYIIDTPLLNAAQDMLAREGRSLGYGVRVGSINVWDGQCDAFSQFDHGMMIEDHGRVDDLDRYYRDKRYRNRALGLPFNRMFLFMGESGVAPINTHIEKIRRQ